MIKWPLQSECDDFYGNPRWRHHTRVNPEWEAENIVDLVPPWQMIDDDTRQPVPSFKMHRKCAPSLNSVLTAIWDMYGNDQKRIEGVKLHLFSGSYVYRTIRGSDHLSTHAYGCALDISGNANPMGEIWHPLSGVPMIAIRAFEEAGWIWGGRWTTPDAMHFQAARIG